MLTNCRQQPLLSTSLRRSQTRILTKKWTEIDTLPTTKDKFERRLIRIKERQR